MLRFLRSLLPVLVLPTACVSVGKLDSQGYTHEKAGYSLPYGDAKDRLFMKPSWVLQVDREGKPEAKDASVYRTEVKSYAGWKDTIMVRDLDLVFKHRETNGVISVQSAPLADEVSEKKLSILAKDQAERLSGLYFAPLSGSSENLGRGRNYVTNIIEGRAGTLGTAETYEVVVDVANAEQLKLNPEHRLMRYKMLLIRPKAPAGWKDQRGVYGKNVKPQDAVVMETYPALIVLTYAMDYAFYQDYLGDFDALVKSLKLKP